MTEIFKRYNNGASITLLCERAASFKGSRWNVQIDTLKECVSRLFYDDSDAARHCAYNYPYKGAL